MVVVLVVIGLIVGPDKESQARSECDTASEACHSAVEKQLESPASAEFSGETVNGDSDKGMTVGDG